MDATGSVPRAARIAAIASFAWIEARRTRLLFIVAMMAAVSGLGGLFVRSLAITESARLQVAFLAGGVRIVTVFVVCMHVLASMLREAQDKGTDLFLSLDLTRTEYLLGKAAGYAGVAALVAAIVWLPLLLVAPPEAAVSWLASLVLECWIVVAAALFCAVTLSQLMLGAAFVLGFYTLSRAMAAVYLIATASSFAEASWSQDALRLAIRGVYLLLPGLDGFTRTEWLVDTAPGFTTMAAIALQSVVYAGLLLLAALFDLHRRNF